MKISEAAEMLVIPENMLLDKTWADLGCGAGTFTLALASLLKGNSAIYAIDTDRRALQNMPATYSGVTIHKQMGDFVKDALPFEKADGILMANSLHYVKEKSSFFSKIKNHLNESGCLLLVEYDTDKPVPNWVPYPVSFQSLQILCSKLGFKEPIKLFIRISAFGGNMYSALVKM